ncbi:MAG: hypothetical protein ACK52I_07145 [Pseudomonadota bacterium]
MPTDALDHGRDPEIDVRCRQIGEHGFDLKSALARDWRITELPGASWPT